MDSVRPVEAIVPGVQGRVLAVLAETTTDLNMRTIARLADVSLSQASRVLASLVELGVVDRRDVPPSSLFRLVREHVAVGPLLALARSRDALMDKMGQLASGLPVVPVSVIVFGSFARGEADVDSDIGVWPSMPQSTLQMPCAVSASGSEPLPRITMRSSCC